MDSAVESALIAAAATLVGVGGTVIVAITGVRNSRRTNQAAIDAARADARLTLDAAREAQFADRYSRALEQVGSANLDVRIGGIYALEAIALDAPRYRPTVMEVLAAFIREHSRRPPDSARPQRWPLPDVQTALTAIGRRKTEHDVRAVDLGGADLSGARLHRADLSGVNLLDVDLRGADLYHADLRRANLGRANLAEAELFSAQLAGANLLRADLKGADLRGVNFLDADFGGADLTGAHCWWDIAGAPPGWKFEHDKGGLSDQWHLSRAETGLDATRAGNQRLTGQLAQAAAAGQEHPQDAASTPAPRPAWKTPPPRKPPGAGA